MSWQAHETTDHDGASVQLSLPPGWWCLPLTGDSLGRFPDTTLPPDVAPVLRAEWGAQWHRLSRAAAVAGAVLLAGGAAYDEADDHVVTASLLVAPLLRYRPSADPDDDGPVGPGHVLRLPAGAAVRGVRLRRSPSPVGDLIQLSVEYRVADTWVLAFSTPALHHVEQLVATFDAIAATLQAPGIDVSPFS